MVRHFDEAKGVIVNPYIGFTSFQHFRGEKLYSDCITGRAGIAGTETENYECYPVPDGVEEKGREQGYYPDTTVAYIRVLWKEYEPRPGEYNDEFIEDIIRKTEQKGQTLMFRLMPHSTCERDDVPDWLKEMMECPIRPAGMRVKDSPRDPRYLELFGRAVQRLGERFDREAALDSVDVSLGGCWGEGSGAFSSEELRKLMDVYLRAFPNTKLLGQLGNVEMLKYIGKKRPIGWRADGTGEPKHMDVLFPERVAQLDPDHWKIAPVSFESYWWVSEWYRQGWDIDEIIEKTLAWHISTFNTKSIPVQYELQEKMEYWLSRMGYRFHISQFSCADRAARGEELKVSFEVQNRGVAPIYNQLPFVIVMRKGSTVYEFNTTVDICSWMPGNSYENISLRLDEEIEAGVYRIYCRIGGGKNPIVKLATDTENDGEMFYLADIEVVE